MVNDLFNSLSKYFNHLQNTGYFSQKNVNKLLAFSLIEEFLHDCQGYLDSGDYLDINKALSCLYGSTCLIPYPNYYNPNTKRTMFIGSCSQLARRVEELERLVEYYHGGDHKPDDPTEDITPTPSITYEEYDNYYIITASGEGEVTLYLDGSPVDNPYQVSRTDQDQTITFAATAIETGKLPSNTAVRVITIPASGYTPDIPTETTAAPTVEYTYDDTSYTIEANGVGEVKLYVNGYLVSNPYIVHRTTVDFTIQVFATAKELGKNISPRTSATIVISAIAEDPEDIDDDKVIIVPLSSSGVIVPFDSDSSQSSTINPNKIVIVPF